MTIIDKIQRDEEQFNSKVTELYDMIHDLNYTDDDWWYQTVNGQNKKIKLKSKNYTNGLVNYSTNDKKWWIYTPQRPYAFSYCGFKAFKPFPIEGKNPNKVFLECDICNSSTKRVAFDFSNLTDGVEYSPVNQVPIISFRIYDPKGNKYYGIDEITLFYDNLEIELDFIYR